MYVCMYVCMYVVPILTLLYVCKVKYMCVYMYVCICSLCVCMYVCMYVCMVEVYIFLNNQFEYLSSRISTGSGSTAAMKSAGGVPMSATSSTLQYMVREQILEEVNDSIQLADGGMINQEEMLLLRWNSQHGALYVDGAHFKVFQKSIICVEFVYSYTHTYIH